MDGLIFLLDQAGRELATSRQHIAELERQLAEAQQHLDAEPQGPAINLPPGK